MKVLGWSFDAKHKILLKAKMVKGETEWVEALPFLPRPISIIRDEDNEIRGFRISFEFYGRQDREIVVPGMFVRASSPANVLAQCGGPEISREQGLVMTKLFTDLIAGKGRDIGKETVVTRAEWVGDELHAPGRQPAAEWLPELAAYGHIADIDEAEAKKAWADIVTNALDQSYRSVIVFGMPIGSIYCNPLKVDSFALHITGESSTGKTESAEIAMSTLSSARRPRGALYRTWDASAQAPTNLLKMTGPLPVWFDETAVLAGDDISFTNLLFRLAQGRGRVVADTEGGLRAGSGERWDASVLSTGEARISNRSGLTGLRRRVLEVYAPLMNRADEHDVILGKARRAYGWPLRWLEESPGLDEAQKLHDWLFGRLSDHSKNQQVEVSQASNIVTCAVGFSTLARLCGVSVPRAELLVVAIAMFEKVLLAAADEGADIGERGLNAIKEAVKSSGNFYSADDELFIRRYGVVFDDGYIGIVGKAMLAEILLKYANLPDPTPVLKRWDDEGILQHDVGKYTGRRTIYVPRRGMKLSTLYLVRA